MPAPCTRTSAIISTLAGATLLCAVVVGCTGKENARTQGHLNVSDAVANSGDEASVGGAAGGTVRGTTPVDPTGPTPAGAASPSQ